MVFLHPRLQVLRHGYTILLKLSLLALLISSYIQRWIAPLPKLSKSAGAKAILEEGVFLRFFQSFLKQYLQQNASLFTNSWLCLLVFIGKSSSKDVWCSRLS